VRRLFSNFARGVPGLGLLLLRLVVGIALIGQAAIALHSELTIPSDMVRLVIAIGGLLLLVGLWTPVVGGALTLIELWTFSLAQPNDPWNHILLATIAAALALIGPGHWSVDAHLFGWRRININNGDEDG
jgi:hypothetical protein